MKVKIFDKSYEFDEVYFTSDIHGGHKNITGSLLSNWKSGYRTFDSIYEMDNHIYRNLLEVNPNDLLVLLGDTLMGDKDYNSFLNYLDCDNVVILHGNHTNRNKLDGCLNKKILFRGDYVEMTVEKQQIVGNHYPLLSWNNSGKGSWSLFGHLHGQQNKLVKELCDNYKTMDVGIDNYYKLFGEYKPFKFSEVKYLLENKTLNEHHIDE